MRYFAKELRWAVRRLWRTPGSTVAALAVLALGIGSTVTVFAIARAVLFKPLSLREPEQLVVVERKVGGEGTFLHSPADLQDLLEVCDGFSALSGSARFRARLAGAARPKYVTGVSVTPEYLETLGARPVLGRVFQNVGGEGPSELNVTVLSWKLWQEELGGDQDVAGETVFLDGEPYRIVGVMPKDLAFLEADLWVPGPRGVPRPPFQVGSELLVRRDIAYMKILGRVRSDWSLDAAREELERVGPGIAGKYPANYPEVRFSFEPFKEQVVGGARNHLGLLWGSVALVFLLGCLSVSGLLLGRGIGRLEQDLIKLTLGASRWQGATASFAESTCLAIGGGILGTLSAIGGVRLVLALAPPFPRSDQTSFDWWVLAGAVGTATFAAVLAGSLPVLTGMRRAREELAAASSGRRRRRIGRWSWDLLLSVEVACMVVLLVVGLMLGRLFLELSRAELGFRPDNVEVGLVELPTERFQNPASLASFFQELLDRLETAPHTEAVGGTLPLPFSGGRLGGSFSIAGRDLEPGDNKPSASMSMISDGYFRTMEIPVLAGRGFGPGDRRGAPPVVVVNQTLAKRYWPSDSPLGSELVLPSGEHVRIVGIVEDVRHRLAGSGVEPRIYRPFVQSPSPAMWIALRTRGSANLEELVRSAMSDMDPGIPAPTLMPMEQMISAELKPIRYRLMIVGGLAVLAVLISAVGLSALLAFTVREKERELALRMALGARRETLLRVHVGRGVLVALGGIVLGAVVVLATSRILDQILPTEQGPGPLLLFVVVLLAVLSACLSGLIGARGVFRLSPSRAVRDL